MKAFEVEEQRIRRLNRKESRPEASYVLYWMQQSQRSVDNPALIYAANRANELGLPLLVGFGLMDDYPEANERHYFFMLQGIAEVERALAKQKIKFATLHGRPDEAALTLGKKAAEIICDRGYLRHQKQWRRSVAQNADCAVWEVEGDVVVPIDLVSNKREYAARTIRPKIHKHVDDFLKPAEMPKLKHSSLATKIPHEMNISDPQKTLKKLKLDRSVQPVAKLFTGGEIQAQKTFSHFLSKKFSTYAENRMHPHTDDVSLMSMYLHFGQVSPVWLLKEALKKQDDENQQSFIEEMLIRRELSMNFVNFTDDYDQYSCLPQFARDTLEEHATDEREHTYSCDQLEHSQTHDPYWNASMQEMRETGYMHNYMRMYWGKKILEWTDSPQQAFETALYLNNKYFIDGRDANSFCGVAWVFGNHDRGWTERPIYGKVRCMMASGLERKTKPQAYIDKVRLRCLKPEICNREKMKRA